jgi:hypothetical protein
MCASLHCPIYVLFDCHYGAGFPSGDLRSFLCFLSGLTELVGVRRFNNVAKTEIWSEFRNVLIVSKCCTFIVRLLRYFAMVIIVN